ncbi:MAG: hypothetical protein ACR2Q3_16465 [Woeseiaceae bacterium]
MTDKKKVKHLLHALGKKPRARLAQLPTPIHRLENFGQEVGDIALNWDILDLAY